MRADRHGHSGGQGQGGDSSERTGEGHGPLRKGSELRNSMWERLWGKQVTACCQAGGPTWELLAGAVEAGLGAAIPPALSPRQGTAFLQASHRSIS